MTPKEKATARNWQKARLLSFFFREDIMTDREKEMFNELQKIRKAILEDWDINTEEILGHPLKPFKCDLCGKRSNKAYVHLEITTIGTKEVNLCKAHDTVYYEATNSYTP